MIVTAVVFSREDRARFDALARETPKAFRSAVGRAFSILRRNIIKVMSGASATYIPALAPWHPLTNRITNSRKFGGKLADSSVIRVYKAEDTVSVGWITSMAGAAAAWQEPLTRPMGDTDRHRLHQILGILKETNHSLIPMIYQRPRRDVMNTLADATTDKMAGWIAGAYEKQIARSMKKGWVTA